MLILRLGRVPLIDASGATALTQFLKRAGRLGIRVIIEGLAEQPRRTLAAMHALAHPSIVGDVNGFATARPGARAHRHDCPGVMTCGSSVGRVARRARGGREGPIRRRSVVIGLLQRSRR